MSILSWLEEQRRWSFLSLYGDNPRGKEGELWIRCDRCGVVLYLKHLTENYQVCYGCNIHLQMTSQARIEQLIDTKTWRTLDNSISPVDPLFFRDQKGYAARLYEAQKRTGLQDALQTGTGLINGIPVALGVMDFYFMGGSMGSVVGERLTRLAEYSTEAGLTLVIVCCSGGARMQEGIFSLMQMAKVSAALNIFQSDAKLLYLSVLTSPTTGGVTASFAMLGDLIISEPRALIGFAGRRIIEQALNEKLPDDFQMAEGLLRHGLIDLIVPRAYLKQAISELLTLYKEAPFKKMGVINYGVRNSLSSTKEELIRRNYNFLKSPLLKIKQFTSTNSSFFADGLVEVESLGNTNTVYLGNNLNSVGTDSKVSKMKNYWFSKITSQFINLFPSKKLTSYSQDKILFFSTVEKSNFPKNFDFIKLTPQSTKKSKLLAIKSVQPCSSQSNFLYSTNSDYHAFTEKPLAISAQIQTFYTNKKSQQKKSSDKHYKLFLASINKKTTLWDGESIELTYCKKETLEKAFCEARSKTTLWVGFYL